MACFVIQILNYGCADVTLDISVQKTKSVNVKTLYQIWFLWKPVSAATMLPLMIFQVLTAVSVYKKEQINVIIGVHVHCVSEAYTQL